MRYRAENRPFIDWVLEDPYWTVDLSKCQILGDVIKEHHDKIKEFEEVSGPKLYYHFSTDENSEELFDLVKLKPRDPEKETV